MLMTFRTDVDQIRGHQLAKAGVEMALWDLRGKLEGRSLREMLGGVRIVSRLGFQWVAILPGGFGGQPWRNTSPAGYGRIKIKIKPGRDVGDAIAVRSSLPEIKLQVDANSAYTLATWEVLKPLDDLESIAHRTTSE